MNHSALGMAVAAIGLLAWPASAGCPDLTGDDCIDQLDLALLLCEWGSCDKYCDADLNGDFEVDGIDLAILVAAWGSCSEPGAPCKAPVPPGGGAGIFFSHEVVAVDNAAGNGDGGFAGGTIHFTFDLVVVADGSEFVPEWTSTDVSMDLGGSATFYQHPFDDDDGSPPDREDFADNPALEFDTYFCLPTSIAPGGAGASPDPDFFGTPGPIVQAPGAISGLWYTTDPFVTAADGTILRFTIEVPAGSGIVPEILPVGSGSGGEGAPTIGFISGASSNDYFCSSSLAAFAFEVLDVGPGPEPGGEVGFLAPREFIADAEPRNGATDDFDGGSVSAGAAELDLVVVIPDPDPSQRGSVQVFLNQGTGASGAWSGLVAQPPILVGVDPSDVAIGLFDADTWPDLAVSNAGDDTVTILINDGTGAATFTEAAVIPVGDEPRAIAAADFDGDGLVDLAVANRGDDDISILAGDGGGGFEFAGSREAPGEPCSLDPEDLDNDKDTDLVVARCADGMISVFTQEPGGLEEVPTELASGGDPRDLATDDVDGNGFADILAVNNADKDVTIWLNQGGGVFTPFPDQPVGNDPRSVDTADVDADGDMDIAVTAEDPVAGASVQLLESVGGGAGAGTIFLPPVAFAVDAIPNFVWHGDLNGDSVDDLITANQDPGGPTGGSVSVLLSGTCPGDLDGDGAVGLYDLLVVIEAWGPNPGHPADLDGDGVVGLFDVLLVLQGWGPCPEPTGCPWDLDGDGDVDLFDLEIVIESFGPCPPEGACPADFDDNGIVEFTDAAILLLHQGPCP